MSSIVPPLIRKHHLRAKVYNFAAEGGVSEEEIRAAMALCPDGRSSVVVTDAKGVPVARLPYDAWPSSIEAAILIASGRR